VKKFEFPLAKVMHFRGLQARLEEVKLEALYAELRAVNTRDAAVLEQKTKSEQTLRSAKSVTGFDLELFASFRDAMTLEQTRLEKARAECGKRIDVQLAVLTKRRRDVRLLEKLKEQRFEKWEKEMFKELDQQADEAYLSKWARERD